MPSPTSMIRIGRPVLLAPEWPSCLDRFCTSTLHESSHVRCTTMYRSKQKNKKENNGWVNLSITKSTIFIRSHKIFHSTMDPASVHCPFHSPIESHLIISFFAAAFVVVFFSSKEEKYKNRSYFNRSNHCEILYQWSKFSIANRISKWTTTKPTRSEENERNGQQLNKFGTILSSHQHLEQPTFIIIIIYYWTHWIATANEKKGSRGERASSLMYF